MRSDHQHIEIAVATLRAGGVVAHPTEGVWGLACDPFAPAAVRRILTLKSRPAYKGLILICAELAQVLPLLEQVSDSDRARIEAPTDKPITWLIPARREVPELLRGRHATLAIRVTRHDQARELCERSGLPLVSTSANPSGRVPALTALRVRQYFGPAVDYVLPGRLGGYTGPSEIRSLAGGSVIRGGG
ncbi:MAG: tRNA threonylcarbamoyladenosine biosynthesis protein RimN [Gammaproteobacteria bacterium]|nr:MAG: tRNA threonylcarbamoyladenosine biosynthesis protein RimN [Gammaproteobacteria bacterium]